MLEFYLSLSMASGLDKMRSSADQKGAMNCGYQDHDEVDGEPTPESILFFMGPV